MFSIKREIYLNREQKELFYRTKNACRFVYNKMIETNMNLYNSDFKCMESKFMNSVNFSKYVNNYLRKGILSYKYNWLNDIPSKPIKRAMNNCEIAFKNFFKGNSGFPKFKSRKNDKSAVYIPKNNKTDFTQIFRNKIKIPLFGFVYLKEFGKIDLTNIKSCTITNNKDKFYISFLINEDNKIKFNSYKNLSIGIDLGIKDFAIFSNGLKFKGISKIRKLVKLEKRIKRNQRKSSKKFKKGEKPSSSNYYKTIRVINNTYARMRNIIDGYFSYILRTLAITKPSKVVIEDLNVAGMTKNRKLSKKIHESSFRKFRIRLENFCNKRGINFIVADRWFPSTQTCSNCGNVLQGKDKLTLKDRIYHCKECGFEMDRDINAATNLSKL